MSCCGWGGADDAGASESEVSIVSKRIGGGPGVATVQPPTVVSAENVSAVVSDVLKDAVPPGTTPGLQLIRVLKSSDAGRDSFAFCALAAPGANAVTATSAAVASNVDKTNLAASACPCRLAPARSYRRQSRLFAPHTAPQSNWQCQ